MAKKKTKRAEPMKPYVVVAASGRVADVCHHKGELMWNSQVKYPPQVIADRFNEAYVAGFKAGKKISK